MEIASFSQSFPNYLEALWWCAREKVSIRIPQVQGFDKSMNVWPATDHTRCGQTHIVFPRFHGSCRTGGFGPGGAGRGRPYCPAHPARWPAARLTVNMASPHAIRHISKFETFHSASLTSVGASRLCPSSPPSDSALGRLWQLSNAVVTPTTAAASIIELPVEKRCTHHRSNQLVAWTARNSQSHINPRKLYCYTRP